MIKLLGIKTKDGIFITKQSDSEYSPFSSLKYYKINGQYPEDTFDKDWNLIKEEPKQITQGKPKLRENYRYELIDKNMANDKIPLSFSKDEAIYYDGYDWVWKKEYRHLQSLYELKFDEVEQEDEVIEFKYKEILSIDDIKQPIKLEWKAYRSEWTHEGTRDVDINNLQFRLLDKIAFPKIYYQTNCPVRLPSKVFYRMLRYYIKQNINNDVAYISSDYDFCFTVKKRIRRLEPKIEQEEVKKANGRSYSKPKYVTKTYQYAGDYTIFEMTNAEDRYKGYSILPDIEAEDLEKLQEKVNNIMKNLINEINREVTLCPCCQGSGIHNDKSSIDINQLITE